MQTFLPFPSFAHSVAVLDRQRLGKQRVETMQILKVLCTDLSAHGDRAVGWSGHPAVKMWRGYESALAVYQTLTVWEWESRGYQSPNVLAPYDESGICREGTAVTQHIVHSWEDAKMPPWLGREDVHSSHRARLLDKKPDWYGVLGWQETSRSAEQGYIWPE